MLRVGFWVERTHRRVERRAGVLEAAADHRNLASLALVLGPGERRHERPATEGGAVSTRARASGQASG